jgi:hypothetical protein
MAAARDLHRVGVASFRTADGVGRHRSGWIAPRCTGRLPHGVGESFEVVTARARSSGIDGEPYNFPSTRRSQPLGVVRAQVVTVGLRVSGERPQNGCRIGVDVRERRYGGTAACGARTATNRAHDVGPYRTLERPATTLLDVTPSCRPVTPETSDLRESERPWCQYRRGFSVNSQQPVGSRPEPNLRVRDQRSQHVHVANRNRRNRSSRDTDMKGAVGTPATMRKLGSGDEQPCTASPAGPHRRIRSQRSATAPTRPSRARHARAGRTAAGAARRQPLGVLRRSGA